MFHVRPRAIAIITISDEIDHIWKRKFTGATLLFFLNRYTTLLKTRSLSRLYVDLIRIPQTWGELWYNIFDIIALFVFAAFSAFRVWAIWGREIRPFLIVLPFALLTPCLNIYRVSAESVIPEMNPLPPPYGGFADIVRGFAIATDGLVLIMTWLRTRGIYRAAIKINTKPSLSAMLLRDGTVYFGVLLIFNIVDLIMNHVDVSENPVNLFSDVVNSIMISRFMLNLRAVHSSSNDHGDVTFTQGHVDFIQSNVLGDLGAVIEYGTPSSSLSSLSGRSALISDGTPSDEESDGSLATAHHRPHEPHSGNCDSSSTKVGYPPSPVDEESAMAQLCRGGSSGVVNDYGSYCASSPGDLYGRPCEDDFGIEVVDR
ncbi:hypothetical protein NM688_g8287 [Phlebia brevispora]|uniref:Uncharacterized protein n=1 Tax=Phlebia brevispora TaxID=194682 RepID=A0ACC1RTY2_9APHY|nr:hypothetical protein NM688_g8287 [Phlebia brevispora]